MSIAAINWAFGLDIKSGQKFVLVALANYADEEGSCFPSYKKLSQKTGISERTIGEHMTALESMGLMSRERRRFSDGTVGGYRFYLHTQNSPVAKSRKTTREKARKPHAKSAGQYNHHNNLKKEPSVSLLDFEKLWKSVGSLIPKSRRSKDKKLCAKKYTALSKEFSPSEMERAIHAYYRDPEVSKDGGKFRPALLSVLNQRSFEAYLQDDPQEPSGPSTYEIYLAKQKETA